MKFGYNSEEFDVDFESVEKFAKILMRKMYSLKK